MSIRKKPECNALNNGAPFVLPDQHAYPAGAPHDNQNKIKVTSVFYQSPDGRMAISLFNPIKHHNNPKQQYNRYLNDEYYTPAHLQLDEIRLNYGDNGAFMSGEQGVGISGVKAGTIFHNAYNPSDTYKVYHHDNGNYYLKREGNGNPVIDLNDSTLVLYSAPVSVPLTFAGRQLSIKPSIDLITSEYLKANKNMDYGKNLLVAR